MNAATATMTQRLRLMVHELAAGQMDGEDGAAADGDDSRSASRVRAAASSGTVALHGVVTGG